MQYTIRNIPKQVDQALRIRAKREGKTLNQAAVDALETALDIAPRPIKRRNLSGVAGSWIEDPAVDAALADQDRIDPEMWK